MNKLPLISIIVPVYNVEDYLVRCVQSIIRQTYTNLEIILVDDGSTDTSSIICDRLAAEDDRIMVIHQLNGGLSCARNAGLDKMTGDYVGFVDSDDWIERDMYDCLFSAILEQEADIAICNHFVEKGGESMPFLNTGECKVYNRTQALEELFKDKIIKNYAWNKLFKKDLFSGLRFPVGRYFEDIALIYKLFHRTDKIVLVCESKYHYLIRDDSIIGNEMNPLKEYHYLLAIHEQSLFEIEHGLSTKRNLYVMNKALHTINHILLLKNDDIYKAVVNNIVSLLHQYDELEWNYIGFTSSMRRYFIYNYFAAYRRCYKFYRRIFKWKWERK